MFFEVVGDKMKICVATFMLVIPLEGKLFFLSVSTRLGR